MPNFPDPSPQLWQQGGYSDYTMEAIVAGAANIQIGTNPAYAISDFLSVYPQFGPSDYFKPDGSVNSNSVAPWPIPQAALQLYVNLAQSCIAQVRWLDAWTVGMSLFIAHFATTWLQSASTPGSTARQVAAAGLGRGMAVSESAGDVNINYESITDDLEGWAGFKLTSYGQQLATLGSLIGMGGMYIW